MNMRGAYVLLSFVVGCYGVQWKPLNDFRDTFKEYSAAAVDTISSIQHILDNSRKESDSFFNDTFANHPVIARIAGLRSEDKCFTRFIHEDELRISFQIQMYQLQIPLYDRIVDIRERLNNINSSLDIYQSIAESKYRSCKSVNGSCLEEANAWLESSIDSLSCAIYSNCSRHSITKRSWAIPSSDTDEPEHYTRIRSVCEPEMFQCITDRECEQSGIHCIGECNGCNHNCNKGTCVRDCEGMRCTDKFECIPLSKRCDGKRDCLYGSDETDCSNQSSTPPSSDTTTPQHYTHVNCSIDTGDFLCNNSKCIGLEQVCDGYNDCGDSSDEADLCKEARCSPECGKKGGVCLKVPEGAKCLYECPPGTYETAKGCSPNPEPPLASLHQVLEDTPRLRTRYAARLNYLKRKTILALSKSLREVVKCKKGEFTSLSEAIDF